ncbi:ASCH domain-containing protein [Nocardioides terrisoli]|uniref:ASCH domain-containing protein n=1 Tax=Nocardioides terrisoli TaxID=3388267 RepID=UPI00287B8330|nr:ASCH domain-containing protein [Nocardioides marmorisolisilvae]
MSEPGPEAGIESFWRLARRHCDLETVPGYFGPSARESVTPPAWSFGATAAHADELLALVLDGAKTATASALWDYEAEDEPLPEPGALSIVLDSHGVPRALLETTAVEVRPFDEVDAEHARLEGEGDRSLTQWREAHERFFTDHGASGHDFTADMPVVLERFVVRYAAE